MNQGDIENLIWTQAGFMETGAQTDWHRQFIRDAINLCLEKIATNVPDHLALQREFILPLITGTGVYTVNDWVIRAASFYTKDTAAHKVRFRTQRNADRNNLRNSSLAWTSLGPWDMTGYVSSTVPYRYGASGPSTGATATNNSTTITIAGITGGTAKGTAFDGSEVGRMLKLNGEYADYNIIAVPSASQLTIDRPFYARLNTLSELTTSVGKAYSNVRWEIGPKQRCQVEFLPMPTNAYNLNYRALVMPRKLLWPDEEPEIPDAYHELLWKGAIKECALIKSNIPNLQTYTQEWNQAMDRWQNENRMDQDTEDAITYESVLQHGTNRLNPDVNPPRSWQ